MNLVVLLAIFSSRIFFTWKFVRGEDRRTLMDLGRPRIYAIAVPILAIAAIFTLIFLEPGPSVFFVSALVIVMLFGLAYAFLEKKYLPNTRRHIASLLTLGVSFIAIAVYLLFNPYP